MKFLRIKGLTLNQSEEEQPEQEEEIIAINLPVLILSPKFQALAGPLSLGLMVLGVGCTYVASWLGIPRAALFAAAGLGTGVAVASVAVTLGIVLLVSKQTPTRKKALISVVCGIGAFLLAGPIFVLIWATNI